MSTDAHDFTDILSAALDESGITGEESFDFDFGEPAGQITQNTFNPVPVPTIESVAAAQRPLVHHRTPVLINGPLDSNRNQPGQYVHPSHPVVLNGPTVQSGNQPLLHPTPSAPILVNGQPVSNGNQADLFSQRLKQLAASTNPAVPGAGPRIINTSSTLTPGPAPGSAFHRSASSPSVIRLPASGGDIVSQLPQILRQQSVQNGDPNKTKIITVKRMGPDGHVTQSRSFTIAGKQPAPPPNGGHKIIVRSANGDQVMQPGSVSQSMPGLPTGAQTNTQTSNRLPPLAHTPATVASSVVSQNVNPSVINSSAGRHMLHMPRTQSEVDFSGNRNLGQTGPGPGRIVSGQSGISQPGTIHVIRRPYMSSPGTTQCLQHSQSVPSHLSNISNIPSLIADRDNRNTSSPVHIISQPSMSGGKVVTGNVTAPNGYNPLHTMSSLAAMQRSVNSLPNNLTNKDVSRMWSNQDIKLKSITPHVLNHAVVSTPHEKTLIEEEEEGEEVEGLGQAETYSDYMPAKLKLGIKHPDPVVETSSMSSIEPPDIFYKLSIPEHTIDYGDLSALQLESIVYASQRHSITLPSGERAGFLIGDGAGVGKGRTLAGIIFENYLLGRKRALWLSVSNDLRHDADRDLRDIGAGKIDVHALNKFKYAKISSKENGSVKKGVIFATYSSLIGESHSGGKYKTRFKQLLKWCGKEFDGVIVFDECHKAKNLCPVGSSKPTKTGQTVLELQKRLPKARVVYASATGASEPKNMAYMTRLGLWGPGTPFPEFNDFIQAVERRGVGAMEMVAMDMKLRGMYIARQLSFKGVSFKIEEIPIDKEYIKVYNEAVSLWVDAREMFQSAAELIDAEHRMRKSMWGQFWSAHQRFFKYLCISAKVGKCVQLAREAIRDGKCVVIGLQSTGEARTLEQLEEMGGELNDFVSTAKGVIQTVVEKHFPAPDRRKFFDIFGLGGGSTNSFNEDSNPPTPGTNKRKKDQVSGNSSKKQKTGSDSEDSSNSDSEESDFDFGLSDLSDDDDNSDSENDNFNPFGAGSDSDDDPWLKKTNSAKTGNKVKEKKKKEKKKKKKKEKKKDKGDDMDAEFDKALARSGLLKKEPVPQTNGGGPANNSGDAVEKAFNMKRELLERIELLGDRLPANPLDQLIDDLGGTDCVAEMTGRKGRVVCTDEGISYESRSENDVPLEILNLTEKQRFMDGEKNIAIISEAASSGISLQADRRAINQRRRVHITLELPWSADRAIQQFGRTHRSNQVSAPEYLFLISELAGEQRFASTVSKRLESLGALTHGDRRATETRDLSRFNFDNKFGRAALESVMKSVCGYDNPFLAPPAYETGDFYSECQRSLVGVGMVLREDPNSIPTLDKDYNSISKFLNRILGMEVSLQNALFKYFSDTLAAIILEAKRSGRWDMGILDLGSGGESVKKLQTKIFVGNTATNTAKTELIMVSVERGMSFTGAYDIWKKYTGVEDGFYLSLQDRAIRRFAIVAAFQGSYNKKKEKLFTVYRPNTGLQPRQETLGEIRKKYKKVLPEEAQRYWEEQYNDSTTVCSHAYWRGSCKKIALGLPCEVGLRTRTYYVLSGSVLSVWNKVESVLAAMPGGNQSKMQVIRLRTDDNQRIVGSLIPGNCVEALCSMLSVDCSRTYTETHKENERPVVKKEEESQAISTLSMPMLI